MRVVLGSAVTKGSSPWHMSRTSGRRASTVDRVRTDRYGKGRRWQARYLDPDGRERTRTFDRKQDAARFLTTITADVLRGAYVDPDAGKVTFADFAGGWLAAQTFSESSREATELRLRLHAAEHFGQRELRMIRPSVIQSCVASRRTSRPPTCAPCSPTCPQCSTQQSTTD